MMVGLASIALFRHACRVALIMDIATMGHVIASLVGSGQIAQHLHVLSAQPHLGKRARVVQIV